MKREENAEIVHQILSKINKPVSFHYPENEGVKKGVLKNRAVMASPNIVGVPYWSVVDLIEFDKEPEQSMRFGYYRKPDKHLVWGSQTTLTAPISLWRQLLVQAANEMDWFRNLLQEVMDEANKDYTK